MSLDYDLTNITDYENLCYYDAPCDMPEYDIKQGDTLISPKTEALVFACMFVGMPQITSETWLKFYTRLKCYEAVSGAMLRESGGKPYYFDPETVRAHIGLKTNANRYGPKQFEDFLYGLALDNQRIRDRANKPQEVA